MCSWECTQWHVAGWSLLPELTETSKSWEGLGGGGGENGEKEQKMERGRNGVGMGMRDPYTLDPIPNADSLPASFSPWTCAYYRASPGLTRAIVEWEAYRGMRGFKSPSPRKPPNRPCPFIEHICFWYSCTSRGGGDRIWAFRMKSYTDLPGTSPMEINRAYFL